MASPSPGGSPAMPTLPTPRPKSPPELYGKRRELAKVVMLEREIGFLQEELKAIDALQPASSCIKEVAEYVVANPEPLISTSKKIRKSCRFWRWLCGKSCFNMSWICCCCSGCPLVETLCCCVPDCSSSCCTCCSCALPKCSGSCRPRCCPRCLTLSSCCPKCDCCTCFPPCTSCPDCSSSCKCAFSCWPTKCLTKCLKCPSCACCSCSLNCCYSCCQCC